MHPCNHQTVFLAFIPKKAYFCTVKLLSTLSIEHNRNQRSKLSSEKMDFCGVFPYCLHQRMYVFMDSKGLESKGLAS